MTHVPLDMLSDDEIERLYDAGLVPDEEIDRIALSRISPRDLAIIDGIGYGLAKLLNTPINQLAAEAAAYRQYGPGAHNKDTRRVARSNLHEPQGTAPPWAYSAAEENEHMSAYPYVGADGQSYPEIASRAVRGVQQQNPSPVYGYLRTGTDQKIYLYQTLGDAQGWFATLTHGQQPHDYAAVFVATDLSRPVHGLESFGHTLVSGDTAVGNLLPFLLGLPAGALGGYFYRGWRDEHPGKWIPGISGDPSVGGPWLDVAEPPPTMIGGPWLDIAGQDPGGYNVGGPWLDIEESLVERQGQEPYVEPYTIGGPWLDIVGAQAQADDRGRPRGWPQTKALIQSAISEVSQAASRAPAEAYVWSLDPPGPSPLPHITLEGTTVLMPFASHDQALDYMRERIRTPHVALALFDRRSTHWPNPVNWTKNNDPTYEPVIAQQIARSAPTRAAGDYVGAYPWQTTIGSALDDVRTRAQVIANKRAGSVVGVIHTLKDGLWHALAFRNADDADDWLGTATQDPASYTYAAYYDKDDYSWPHPVNEKIGGGRVPSRAGAPIRRGRATTSGNWWAA